MRVSLYGGLIADFKKYTYEIGFSLFEWSFLSKKSKTITLLCIGPFSLSIFNNEELEKKLEEMVKTEPEEEGDAICSR